MKTWVKALAALFILLLILFFFVLPTVVQRMMNQVSPPETIEITAKADSLHDQLWVADLHADALLWNRDLLERHDHGHVDIPRLIAGNVALQAFTIVSKTPFGLNYERNAADSDMITFLAIAQRWPARTWFSLKERALYQAQKLHRFAEDSDGTFRVIHSQSELHQYIAQRETNPHITAGFLGIEGAQVLEKDTANVQVMFDAGFRMLAPSHFFDTAVGGSAHGVEQHGLTDFGRWVIRKMAALGMAVDLAHASPATIDDVLAIATRPVLVSHTGVKGTCNSPRNLSDKHLRGIAGTGGVIGIGFFSGATCGEDIAAIVRAIRYTADLVGVEHVGLGSDFDGTVTTPFDAAGMRQLTSALLTDGFTAEEVAQIMGGNVQRMLLELLPQ